MAGQRCLDRSSIEIAARSPPPMRLRPPHRSTRHVLRAAPWPLRLVVRLPKAVGLTVAAVLTHHAGMAAIA